MDRVIKTNQAFYETPWRKQIQWIIFFLVLLILFGLIAGIYLSINADATTIGRQIQNDRIRIQKLENQIADQESHLAMLLSATEMEKRAINMGFHYAKPDEILYLAVEGYKKPTHAVMASETENFLPSSVPVMTPEFTQTLWDLVKERISFPDLLIR